jgi:sulfur carrier protein ThiS
MSAHIQLKLFAGLAAYRPDAADRLPIAPGTTVRDLMADLGIPEAEARLVFVNSVKAGADARLQDGDRVGIFPPVGGG